MSGTSKDHGQQLSSLKDRLRDFEKALDELEDWALPKIARVESKEFMTQELPKIGDEIQVRALQVFCWCGCNFLPQVSMKLKEK